MSKYLFAEKECEAGLLSDLFLQLEDMLDDIREDDNLTDYKKARFNAIVKIQNYLLKYYD